MSVSRVGTMKLSEIWDRAAKELKQCRNHFGSAKEKEACASSAIAYYLSGKKIVNPNDLSELNFKKYRELVRLTDKISREHSIQYYNDEERWTFKRFADKARELGI